MDGRVGEESLRCPPDPSPLHNTAYLPHEKDPSTAESILHASHKTDAMAENCTSSLDAVPNNTHKLLTANSRGSGKRGQITNFLPSWACERRFAAGKCGAHGFISLHAASFYRTPRSVRSFCVALIAVHTWVRRAFGILWLAGGPDVMHVHMACCRYRITLHDREALWNAKKILAATTALRVSSWPWSRIVLQGPKLFAAAIMPLWTPLTLP